jgi:integrase
LVDAGPKEVVVLTLAKSESSSLPNDRTDAKAPRRLTEAAVHKLPIGPTRYDVFDTAVPGLAVRVGRSGRSSYALYYRVLGRLRCATLGRVGVLTLDEARRRARSMLVQASGGTDPLAARDGARDALTVAEAATQWLDDLETRRKPTTLRSYRLAVNQHITPKLGNRPIVAIEPKDVAALHMRLRATPYLANRVLAALSSLCSWCERRGLRPIGSNPCCVVERFRETARKRYLTIDEYGRLGRSFRKAEKAGTVSPIALTAIRLLTLTGCRPAEIVGLRWAEVDLDVAVLRLVDSKTGAKTVHLPAEAVTLLRGWPRFKKSVYVFPGTATGRGVRGKHLVNLSKAWAILKKYAKLKDVRLYDAVRHSFASVAVSSHGHALSVVGELLGHRQAATTKRYAHLHDEAARKAVAAIGGTIAAALGQERP